MYHCVGQLDALQLHHPVCLGYAATSVSHDENQRQVLEGRFEVSASRLHHCRSDGVKTCPVPTSSALYQLAMHTQQQIAQAPQQVIPQILNLQMSTYYI